MRWWPRDRIELRASLPPADVLDVIEREGEQHCSGWSSSVPNAKSYKWWFSVDRESQSFAVYPVVGRWETFAPTVRGSVRRVGAGSEIAISSRMDSFSELVFGFMMLLFVAGPFLNAIKEFGSSEAWLGDTLVLALWSTFLVGSSYLVICVFFWRPLHRTLALMTEALAEQEASPAPR